MSILGSVLGTAANIIPGVGPLVSAGIFVVDGIITKNKKDKEAELEAIESKRIQKSTDFLKNEALTNSIDNLGSNQYSKNSPVIPGNNIPLLGQNTLLGEKFGTSSTILGQAMNLETLKY